jgi:hypothetical protein
MIKPHRRPLRLVLVAALLLLAGPLAAHDLFLKLNSYFIPVHTAVQVAVLNGTFSSSEGPVARDRVADLSLVGPEGRAPLDTTALSGAAKSSTINLHTAGEGTYVLGMSVRPREIALTGEQFTGYLKEEGIDDMLSERARTGESGTPAKERYAKHVKAIFQVGQARSDRYATVLGYTAEIVPLENPYALRPGATLRVRCLINGQPAAGLTVLAGGVTSRGTVISETRNLSDSAGIAQVRLASAGRWYVKFISMRRSTEPGITHESQWATLTFELR